MSLCALASLLISVALLSWSITVLSDGSSDTGDYSHALCTAPILDEQPATHYRGTWGINEFLTARTLQRVCLYSNICLQLVQHAGEPGYFVEVKCFVPAPPSQEWNTSSPPHYLGFERFSHGDWDAQFEVVHGAVPKDHAWATDAGVPSLFFSGKALVSLTPAIDVHFLTESYANNNFGHILIDDLYSVFHAMQHWGIGGYNSSRILSFQNCIAVRSNGSTCLPCPAQRSARHYRCSRVCFNRTSSSFHPSQNCNTFLRVRPGLATDTIIS